MLVSRHITFSLLPSAAVYLVTSSIPDVAFFLTGAVLIDFDHYLDYVHRTKKLSPVEAYRYNVELLLKRLKRLDTEPSLHYFHTVESLIIMLALSVLFPPVKWILPGVLFHVGLDLYGIARSDDLNTRSHSILWHWWRKRRKKRDSRLSSGTVVK